MFDRQEEIPALHLYPSRKLEGAEQEHVEQLGAYADLKHSQSLFCDHILDAHPEQVKLIQALRACGSWLYFLTFETGEGDVSRLAGGFTCKKHLFCICCATRRSGRYANSYEIVVRHLLGLHSFLVPVLITYTVKDGPDFLERFEHLRKAQRTLLDRRSWVLNPKSTVRCFDTILRYIHGGAGSYEVKIGSGSGEWHVHIHEIALLDAREFTFTEELVPVRRKNPYEIQRFKVIYVPQGFKSALRDEWFELTGDSHQVDVRGLYPRQLYSKLSALPADLADPSCFFPSEDDIFSGVCEAFKYAVKPGDMTHEQLYHVAASLSGRRMVYSYGSLRNVQIPDEAFDDVEQELRACRYYERVYRYYQFNDSNSYGYAVDHVNYDENILHGLPPTPLEMHQKNKRRNLANKLSKRIVDPDLRLSVKRFAEEDRLKGRPSF